jgi:hypothetical protein
MFASLQRRRPDQLLFSDGDMLERFLIGLHHDFQHTMIEFNIRSTFQDLGFHYDMLRDPWAPDRRGKGPARVWVQAGLRDDFPAKDLPKRRRDAMFDWINSRNSGSSTRLAFDLVAVRQVIRVFLVVARFITCYPGP